MLDDEVRAAVASISMLAGYSGPVERLGGLTNRVFRLGDKCLRIPGVGTSDYINRAQEGVAAHEAARVGVAPEVLYFDEITGLMVTRFVEGAETMSPQTFKMRPEAPMRAGRAFRALHQSNAVFPFRFELFAMIDDYLAILSKKDIELPFGYHDVVREADRSVRSALNAHVPPLSACHCDPLCENLLDAGDRMWIVDWEYSGMNDPMWDLGDLSIEGGFNEQQDEQMIQAYFGSEPRPAERGRMVMYKAMCDLLWTLWGLIQLANENPADDFRVYADARFRRCMTLMGTEDFLRHLKNVARG